MDQGNQVPEYVRNVQEEAARVSLERVRRNVRPGRGRDPVLISVIKDEVDRLPALLEHYRGLGVTHFVFLDNVSSDGSAEFLKEQPDVDLFRVERPFDWIRKQGWIHRAIREYGRDRWYVYVDADEHIVYDGCAGRSLADLAAKLGQQGIRRVRGMLVDLYAPGPILRYAWDGKRPLSECFGLFDAEGYEEKPVARMISRRGGPRPRCLAAAGVEINPELTKYPLFRLAEGEWMANPHHIYPYADNFQSPCYLGILHFKFLPGLRGRIDDAIERGSYWQDSVEYRSYRAALEADPDLALEGAGTRRYRDVGSLLEAGLIERVDWGG